MIAHEQSVFERTSWPAPSYDGTVDGEQPVCQHLKMTQAISLLHQSNATKRHNLWWCRLHKVLETKKRRLHAASKRLWKLIGRCTHLSFALTFLSPSFTGNIPSGLGNLLQMTFLALNSNKLTGTIPPSLGLLSKLFWLDLADNALIGTVPMSTGTAPGLDLFINMKHLLFDRNQFTSSFPRELGGISSLQVLRLDGNQFSGAVPNITNFALNELAQNSYLSNLEKHMGTTFENCPQPLVATIRRVSGQFFVT